MRLGPLTDFVARLARACALPSDSQDERVRKATFIVSVAVTIVFGVIWAAIFALLGYPLPASIPFVYSVASSISLLLFFRTRRYRLFRSIHLLLMLVLPFLLQLSLGGYVASGAVIVWSFMAPVGGLVLAGRREGVPWFMAFVGVIGLAGVLEANLVGPPVPAGLSVTFFVINIAALASVVYLLVQYFMRGLAETRAALEREQERSERLLLNVLPQPIAERLKGDQTLIADAFPEATVLFADIVGFTTMSERLPPEQVVDVLNTVFSEFDELVEEKGLEKIKTIGDAYMAAAGVPVPRDDQTEAVMELALEMREVAAAHGLQVRIGIDSGPVVAGIIGKKKFSYDLWGDTVNTASRMESQGLPDHIQVTPRVYRRLADTYDFVPRGPIQVKGKGRMEPFLLRLGTHVAR